MLKRLFVTNGHYITSHQRLLQPSFEFNEDFDLLSSEKNDIGNHAGLQFQFNVTWHFLSLIIGVFYQLTYCVDGAQAIFDPNQSHYNSIIWVTARLEKKSNYIYMN